MTYVFWLIVVLVGTVALWRPKQAVGGLILLWPSYLLRHNIGSIPTTALELSLYAVAAGTFIHGCIHRIQFPRPQLPKTWWILYGFWSLGWILATLFATNHQEALGALKAWWFDATLFGGLLLFVGRQTDDQVFFLKSAIISGFIVALAGLVQMVAFRGTLQDGRLSSFFHPVANYAAMYLGPLFTLGAGALIWRALRGWLWWLAVSTIALALLLTVSFAGYFAAVFAIVALWWLSPSGQLKRRLGVATLLVIIVAALIIPRTHFFAEHFRTSDRSSGLVRTQIWVTSWSLIRQHPITGIGPNTFEPQYRLEVPKHFWPPLEWLVAQPHNLYLALWLETSLVGAIAFLALMAWWIRSTWRRTTQLSEVGRVISRVCVIAVVGILVHGLFDTPYFKNDLALECIFLLIVPRLTVSDVRTKQTPR